MVYSEEAIEGQSGEERVRFTLPKSARLHHQSLIDGLFSERNNLYDYPLRLSWRQLSDDDLSGTFRNRVPEGIGPVQIMVSVPKKKRRHAVDRVRLRRLVREAYRLQCRPLRETVEERPDIRTLSVAFIWLDRENADYASVHAKVGKLLARLRKRLAENAPTAPGPSADTPSADSVSLS